MSGSHACLCHWALPCRQRRYRQVARWAKRIQPTSDTAVLGLCVLVVFLLMVASLKQHEPKWMALETKITCVTGSPSGWVSDEERDQAGWSPNLYWSPSLCSSSLLFSFSSFLPSHENQGNACKSWGSQMAFA